MPLPRRRPIGRLALLVERLSSALKGGKPRDLSALQAQLAKAAAELEAANAKLRLHRKELQEYIDSMTEFTAKVALDGRILMANKAAQRTSGLSQAELLGQDFVGGPWWGFDSEVRARVREAFRTAAAGKAVNCDERVQVAGGKIMIINLSLVPMRDLQGRVSCVMAEGRDVTERSQAAELLRHRSDDLARSNADLEMFAYAASHDLQDPLRKIISFGDLLKKRSAALDEEGRDFVERMQRSALRMSTLVQDILQLSKVLKDTRPFETVDLNILLAEVMADLEPRMAEAGADIASERLPSVRAHPGQMRQLFQNLLSNALKFRSKDSPLRVRVATGPGAPGFAELRFSDNGIGFEAARAEEVFQPFRRLNPRADYEGSGIGLAVCRKIMARHGGWIAAESSPGKGATFTVTLPLSPA